MATIEVVGRGAAARTAQRYGRVGWLLAGWLAAHGGCATEHGADLLAEACEHLQADVGLTRTLGADADGAVDITAAHQHVTLGFVAATFDGGGSGQGGIASLAVGEAGDHAFLLDVAVPMRVYGPDGTLLQAESTASRPAGCVSAESVAIYGLGVGLHRIEFGPTPLESARLMVEPVAHDDHD